MYQEPAPEPPGDPAGSFDLPFPELRYLFVSLSVHIIFRKQFPQLFFCPCQVYSRRTNRNSKLCCDFFMAVPFHFVKTEYSFMVVW